MSLLRAALGRQSVRFALSGAVVALIALSLTSGLYLAGVTFQLAFLVSWAPGTTIHFLLHRYFTFAGDGRYALEIRRQAPLFMAVVLAQYLTIAGGVAVLAPVLTLPNLAVYLALVVAMAVVNLLLLAARVFHRHDPAVVPPRMGDRGRAPTFPERPGAEGSVFDACSAGEAAVDRARPGKLGRRVKCRPKSPPRL